MPLAQCCEYHYSAVSCQLAGCAWTIGANFRNCKPINETIKNGDFLKETTSTITLSEECEQYEYCQYWKIWAITQTILLVLGILYYFLNRIIMRAKYKQIHNLINLDRIYVNKRMSLLTPEEEKCILRTWALVAKDLKGNGVQFFIHFFTGYPEYQAKFRGFADIPLDKLAENKRLQAHAFTVLNAINGIVENLGDVEVLTEILINTGRSHSRRKLKPGDFENLKESLLDFFSKALASEWSPEAQHAWTKVLTIMMAKISEGLNSPE